MAAAMDGRCQDRVALQRQHSGRGSAREQPAGVAQPRLVGHEHEDCAGDRPFPQPPYALGEARPVGGESLPDYGEDPSA